MMPAAIRQQTQPTIFWRRERVSAGSISRCAAAPPSAGGGFQALKCSRFSRWRVAFIGDGCLVVALETETSIVQCRIWHASQVQNFRSRFGRGFNRRHWIHRDFKESARIEQRQNDFGFTFHDEMSWGGPNPYSDFAKAVVPGLLRRMR